MRVEHRPPWLIVDLGAPMRVLSWAPHRPGLVESDRIVWREVRNADLTPDLDVTSWLANTLHEAGLSDAVSMITSRSLEYHCHVQSAAGAASVECVATVGLGNAERIGQRNGAGSSPAGTINIAAKVTPGLSAAALVEAIAIVAEARTAAVIEARRNLPTGIATGTGTDCIAVASPKGGGLHAGKHTEIGEALGQAVFSAVSTGVAAWVAAFG